jgi:hypothetical protein
VSASLSSLVAENINWGAGLSDQSPFLNDLRGTFAPANILDRFGDQITSQIITNVVYGQDPFAGFDALGRSFLTNEIMALAQFGIGELGHGNASWEGSPGHLLLHGGLGCALIEVMDGDCVAGFFAGVSQSLLAGSNLSDEQKLELAPLVGALSGYVFSGGNAINVSFGSTIAQSGIVNNYLTHADLANANALLRNCTLTEEECRRLALAYLTDRSAANDFRLARECGADTACMLRIMGGSGYRDPDSFATAHDISVDLDGSLVETVLSRGLDRVSTSVIGQFMLSPDFAERLDLCGPEGQAMCVFEGLARIDPEQIALIETILSLNPATATALAVQRCRDGDQDACLSVSTAVLEAMASGARTASTIVSHMTNGGNGGGLVQPRRVGNLQGGPLENATRVTGRFNLESGPRNGTIFRADNQGNITSYATYDSNGQILKRVDVIGAAHNGIPTPHVVEYGRNTLPDGTVRVQTPRSDPRPATPDEIP